MRIFKQVPRILFGEGYLDRLGELLPAKSGGEDYYVYLVDHVHKGTSLESRIQLQPADLLLWVDTSHEPSTALVDGIRDDLQRRRKTNPTAIIGIGGGSSMDVGKAVSVMLTHEGSSSQYQGWDLLKRPGIYKVGVPTISGSGSEASRTAVLMGPEKKFGINSDYSMFDAIVMDSTLIKTVPKDQRFYTAMDCYIHSVEALEGSMKNALSEAYASHALKLCRDVLLRDGTDDQLMTASFMGGCSVVNSEVGVCHALSYGLSLELGFRHGIANCIAFRVLEEYYGVYVNEFTAMMQKYQITLPQGVTRSLDEAALNRMIDMTLRMERPLTNALGADWRQILTREKIAALYHRM